MTDSSSWCMVYFVTSVTNVEISLATQTRLRAFKCMQDSLPFRVLVTSGHLVAAQGIVQLASFSLSSNPSPRLSEHASSHLLWLLVIFVFSPCSPPTPTSPPSRRPPRLASSTRLPSEDVSVIQYQYHLGYNSL